MYWHIDTDIVGLLVMCALYYYTIRMLPEDQYTTRNRSFVWCLRAGIWMTVFDIAASIAMDIPTALFLYHLLMTAYLLTQNLAILLWIMFALTILYENNDLGRKRVSAAVWTVYGITAALILSNPWTGWFYTLGPDFVYARGPLFGPGIIGLNYAYAATLLALVGARWKHIPHNYPKAVLVLQPVILMAALHVQLANPGWLMIYSGYMLCLVLAFLFFQNVRVRSERAQLRQLTDMIEHFACGVSICRIAPGKSVEIQYLSGGLSKILGFPPAALQSRMEKDIFTGVHPKDRELVKARIDELLASGGVREITCRYVTDRGSLKWLHIHAEAEKRNSGDTTIYSTYTDLTELKKAEELLDVALTNTGVSIWEYDYQRRCIIQYQNSAEMHGFEKIVPNVPQSLVESGFVHPDSAPAFSDMYKKLLNGAKFAEGVFKVMTSDRKGYWYEHIRYTNELDEKGRPYRAVGMSTDETQRQDAMAKYERELEKERGFMAEENLIAHATFDLTTGVTLDYRYQDGSEVPEEERTTLSHASVNAERLIDEEERARYLALKNKETLLQRFAAGETEFRLEYRRTLPSGNVSWVRNTMRMLRDPRSGDILAFEYWYDIEEEKMQELMFRSVAADNYDFVARINGKTKRFKSLLKERLTYHMPPNSGDDADAVTMALYNDCVLAEDRDMAIQNSLIENVKRHLSKQGRFVFTYRMKRPDGSLRYKKVTQYYIDAQREMIAVMREDVTDLIRAETEKNRALSEALEGANQASRAKSQFLSRVSHELRTPLNAIIGFMELSKGADAEQTASYLASSGMAAKQLLSIINDVLDVSSIESGKMKIAHAPFDFKRMIQNITDLYLSQCRQKSLEYETILVTPVDEWLIGDQLRVNQILLNLLNNALKFTEHGRVWLEISQRPAQKDSVIVRFQVSDTGCGMTEDMQKRLFRPFEQESATTAQKYGGSGLGLSIVGSLVGMMDGVVNVKSRQDEGTSFIVDLPFTKSKTDETARVIEGMESVHVLAIDDQAVERDYVSSILKHMGVRHQCVSNGVSALSELERGRRENDAYNVCLVDWKMADMNGVETTRLIRRHYGPDLVVIIVSAYDHYQADESVKAAGANMFVSKPLFQSSLFDIFATLTNGRIARRDVDEEKLDLKEMRVLLVEDNAINRTVAEKLLSKMFGIQCDCAGDGKIAVDAFLASAENYYDAILMDIQMPNMDGFEATRQIRASARGDAKDVQIIALTANAFNEDVTKSLSSGMNAHISKPIEPGVLAKALSQAYAKRRHQAT